MQVPQEYVNNGEIVLNIGLDATSGLQLGNDFIEFKARFGGKPREIMVPVGRVVAIYARENGQGMAFPPPVDLLAGAVQAAMPTKPDDSAGSETQSVMQLVPESSHALAEEALDEPPPPPSGGASRRATLKRVK